MSSAPSPTLAPEAARGRFSLPVPGELLAVLPAALIVLAVLVLPVGYLMLFSFNPSSMGVMWLVPEFTLANYVKMLSDSYYWGILWRTFWISAVTTGLSVVFGFVVALSLWRAPARWRGLLTLMVLAPLLVSIVARTFGWIIILGQNGLVNAVLGWAGIAPLSMMYTDGAVIVGLVHVFLPYVVLTTLASLDRVDRMLPEAAYTLGASGWTTAKEILLPLAMPGLAAGATIVFSLSMSSYVTPAMMGGADSHVLATIIYQQFVVNFTWHFGAVLVTVLIAASILSLMAMLVFARRAAQKWGADT